MQLEIILVKHLKISKHIQTGSAVSMLWVVPAPWGFPIRYLSNYWSPDGPGVSIANFLDNVNMINDKEIMKRTWILKKWMKKWMRLEG